MESEGNKKIIGKLLSRFKKHEGERSNIEPIWQDIADYCLPHSSDITRVDAYMKRDKRRDVFDDTGVKAAEYLASAIHAGSTSPMFKWFNLGLKQSDNIQGNLGKWLETARDRMLDIFNSSTSGFPLHTHEFLISLVTFGTACMFIEDGIEKGVHFNTIHMSEIFIAEDKHGKVDTIFRKFSLTVRQMIQKWGDNVGEKVQKMYEKEPDTKISILHVCVPKDEVFEPKLKAHEYVSYYIDLDNERILSVSGYYECPYIIARFSKLSGEVYGRSPAWGCLNEMRMVSKMRETLLKAAQMQAVPPLLVADDGVMMPLRAIPGGLIMGGISYDGTQRVAPLNVGGSLPIGIEMLRDAQKAIRDSYFVDQLVFRDGPTMTATEVMQRQQESMRLLAPHSARYQSEFLQHVIEKVFNILARGGRLGQIPQEILDAEYEVEYTSPLNVLQRSSEVQKFGQFLQFAMGIAQVNPGALDVIDFDAVMAKAAADLGIWKEVQRSNEELTQIREQRNQTMAAEQMLNAGTQMADMVGKISPMVGGNGK